MKYKQSKAYKKDILAKDNGNIDNIQKRIL